MHCSLRQVVVQQHVAHAEGPLGISRQSRHSNLASTSTVCRQQFVSFGTVKSIINAAKAGLAPDHVIEVWHAPKKPTTTANEAEVF